MTIILSLIAGAVVGGGLMHWWHSRNINLSIGGKKLATKDGTQSAASSTPTNHKKP